MSDKITFPPTQDDEDHNNLQTRLNEDGKLEITLKDSGEVSDGWHTFDELYHYRMLYNAGMATYFHEFLEEHGPYDDQFVVKSWRHSDGELCFGKDNYFVVVMQLPTGQVSNHYKGEYWDLFKVPEVERAPEWDGHTPQQAAERLEAYLRQTS